MICWFISKGCVLTVLLEILLPTLTLISNDYFLNIVRLEKELKKAEKENHAHQKEVKER